MKQFLRTIRAPLIFLLICAAPLGLAAAVGARPPTSTWLNAPGWSRAHVVGTTSNEEPTPLVLDEQGQIYLVLTHAARGSEAAEVVALDRQAGVAWRRSFEPLPGRLGSPQLMWDGQELALFFLNDAHLYAARLNRAGDVVAPPAVVSGETLVAAYSVARGEGDTGSVWYAGAEATPGIFAAPLATQDTALRIAETGSQPAIRYDADGALHAVWLTPGAAGESGVAYMAYPDGGLSTQAPQLIARIAERSQGAAVDGPWLGLDNRVGYVTWTIELRAGLNAGQHFSQYVSFPLGQPGQASQVLPLAVPASVELEYAPAPDLPLAAGPRASLADFAATEGLAPAAMVPNAVPASELVLAAETQLPRAGAITTQIGMLFFRDGVPASYQLLSFGQRSAFSPWVTSDESGGLYATWREVRGTGSAVYVAATASDIVQALAVLSADDIARMANDVVFGMLAGIVLSPFTALFWLAPALLVLLPTWFMRRHDAAIHQWGTALSLALGVAAFWIAKLTFVRAALAEVPFAAWVPVIPAWLAPVLQVGTPLLIALGATWLAYALTYGRQRPSAALFVLLYGGEDGLLTMAVYGEFLVRQ